MSKALPGWGWIIVLLLLLGLLLAVFAQTGTQTQTATQSEPNHCLNGGNNFDYTAEVQSLAQDAQDYRSGHSYGGNYGNASITICYSDGSFTAIPSGDPPFKGYKSPTPPENSTHSEWKAFEWAKEQLQQLQLQPGKTVVKIFVAIFSQVRVCNPCRYTDIPTWMRDLRTATGRQNVSLTIWQIRPRSPSAFDPGIEPEGVPLNPADLQIVPVNFTLK
jgi:hypothetical protein